ncbi:LicD family protein [Oribacterium sp. NK2B42]|uniref:LicD family protein n=1 Tax=Oribacterium sp. NK2B42 TaxID=689781 RepID=UPI0018DCA8E7|nr:LicD family protein [Oribacterium sp. NK2B42]
MIFPEDYFEDEVREGFLVTGMMKRYWGAQLQILEDIDDLCQKYNIKYYCDCGTLLGAIRHGGFIPWDDDLDISLLRDDYNKLLDHAHELPENYTLLSWRTREDWTNAFSRIVNSTRICLDKDFLEKYHGFPYSTGIDIFVIDYLYTDADKEEERRKRAKMLMDTAETVYQRGSIDKELAGCINDIENMLGIKIDFNESVVKQLYYYAEKALMEVSEKDAAQVCFTSWWIEYHSHVWNKSFSNQIMRIPFEYTTVPVPVAYDEILKVHYGDYMKVNRNAGLHDYPCYARQEKVLIENLGKKIWECQWNNDKLTLRKRVEEEIRSHNEQLKINIEKIEALIKSNPSLYSEFQKQLDSLKASLSDPLSARESDNEEVVFLTLGPRQWNYFAYFWNIESSKNKTSVFVIPIPYYETSINTEILRTHFNTEGYNIPVTSLNDYDISKRHPNRIYIQYPFDNINPAMRVHDVFYSDNLLKYTDELIYVPMYDIKDYYLHDIKSDYTLNYLVKTPAVLNSDKIFLPTPGLKDEYIRILVDFSKGDTDKVYWDQKIIVADYIKEDGLLSNKNKKTLLYYSDVAPVAIYGDKSLEKIRSSLKLLKEASDRLNIIWLISPNMKEVLNSPDCHGGNKLYSGLIYIIQNFKKENWGTFSDDISNIDLDNVDAYVGNPSPYAHHLSNNKKPVMILKNYDE